jgi:ribosomal protein S18 acetylase RimI-like enzyme
MTTTALDGDSTTVATVMPANKAAAVRVLSAAFQEDPVFEWWIPDALARATALPTVFDAYIDAYASHDATRVANTAAGPAGVAIWARPGAPLVQPEDEEEMTARCLEVVDDAAAQRLRQIVEAFEAVHPHDPHWYLQFLATDPPFQGRGIGAAMLRDVLAAADEAGQAAYTEATSLRNRALYERHGFAFTREIRLPEGPSLYAVWRDPQ